MNDDDIQRMLDEQPGYHLPGNEDVQAYKEMYGELGKLRNNPLPPGFAHRITAKIEKKETSDRRLIVMIVLGILAICVLGFGVLRIYLPEMPQIRLYGGNSIYIFLLITLMMTTGYTILEKKLLKH